MKKGIALLLALVICLGAVPALAGWEESGGRYWYSYEDGGWAANRWIRDGAWYYMDGDGWMVTGWKEIDGTWYYFGSSGAMTTGWKKINGSWYFFDSSGAMKTGWQLVDSSWYLFGSDGAMVTGWYEYGGAWYYFDATGAMSVGWKKAGNDWYYFDASGTMVTGWKLDGGSWYYLGESGAMKTGWIKSGGEWYYLGTDGSLKTGWQKDGDIWYYLDDSGLVTTGWKSFGDTWYYFEDSGAMVTDWKKIGSDWYYFAGDGRMATGWVKIGEDKYYFQENGVMVTGDVTIDGKKYHFDESGKNTDTLEMITITVFVGDPGQQPTEDNKIYKLMEEELGVKFEFEYLTGDLDETLGLKLASNNLPDLFCGSNSADMLVNSGALVNLLDYVSEEKTPRLWAHIQSKKDLLIEKDEKGNDVLYIIPNYGLVDGAQIVNEVSGPAFFIQKQVLEWADYPEINTIDEYFDLLERFIAANPTDADGNPYSGFEILCEDWRNFCLLNPVQHLMGRPNDGTVIVCVTDQNYKVTGNDPSEPYKTETFIDKPYAKLYYMKLNEEYQADLIPAATFEMTYDEYLEKISKGLVLGMFDQGWDFGAATAALKDAKMYDRTYVALDLVYSPEDMNGEKIEANYVNGTVPNVNRGFGISVNCKDPERIVSMWEEMMSDEWQIILNWGIEGEDYTITEDGRLSMTDAQYENMFNAEWKRANKADDIFANSPKKQGYILNNIQLGDKTITAGNCWEPGNQPEIVYDQMNDYDKDFLSHYGYKKFGDFVNSPIELAPYGEAWQIDTSPIYEEYDEFLGIECEELPQLITCDPEEFDNKWDEFVAKIKDAADTVSKYFQEEILKMVGE